ncbi:hypothetical protein Syun_026385 [Stephania yunnanensis]|uniref:Uncharacterized protein n=1 Tax=Stephania yunnanensis TaxID=152371 RepID=A0AAP0ETH1_9MAGN
MNPSSGGDVARDGSLEAAALPPAAGVSSSVWRRWMREWRLLGFAKIRETERVGDEEKAAIDGGGGSRSSERREYRGETTKGFGRRRGIWGFRWKLRKIICFWGIEGIHFAEYVALSNGDCGAWSFDVTLTKALCKWNVDEKSLAEVKLSEAAKMRTSSYSGGMKRRLIFAIALIGDPKLHPTCNGSETELLYSVSDPLLIRDGSETKSDNSVSDPLLIRDGSETEYNYNCTP